jgi:hypothetical protein
MQIARGTREPAHSVLMNSKHGYRLLANKSLSHCLFRKRVYGIVQCTVRARRSAYRASWLRSPRSIWKCLARSRWNGSAPCGRVQRAFQIGGKNPGDWLIPLRGALQSCSNKYSKSASARSIGSDSNHSQKIVLDFCIDCVMISLRNRPGSAPGGYNESYSKVDRHRR